MLFSGEVRMHNIIKHVYMSALNVTDYSIGYSIPLVRVLRSLWQIVKDLISYIFA